MATTQMKQMSAAPMIGHLQEVENDLLELERNHAQYLEQESLKSDIQCLRSWIEASQKGDGEAIEYLQEHGKSLLENVKSKFQEAAREIQRVDEESPNGGNFSGGKADRLTEAAKTALHAECELALALNDEPVIAESTIVSK